MYRNWTKKEKDFVLNNKNTMSKTQMAEKLNRSYCSVRYMVLNPDAGNKLFWNEQNICYLKENYGKISNKEIGIKLGKTRKAIGAKAYALCLKPKKKSEPKLKVEKPIYKTPGMPYIPPPRPNGF